MRWFPPCIRFPNPSVSIAFPPPSQSPLQAASLLASYRHERSWKFVLTSGITAVGTTQAGDKPIHRQSPAPDLRARMVGPLSVEKTDGIRHWRAWFALAAIVFILVVGNNKTAAQQMPSNTQVDSGTEHLGTYDGLHDNVSVGSGNLSFCIPLVSLPGLIGHNLTIPLCYNSQYNEPVQGETTKIPVVSWFPWNWPTNTPVMGPGWTLTGRPGVYTYNAPNVGLVIFMPDGTKYTLPAGTGLNWGADWSGGNTFLMPANGWLYQKNGTRTTGSVSTTTQEYDAHGSLITFTPTAVTDTVGRTVNISTTAASGNNPTAMAFSYPDSNGISRTVTVQFTTINNTCTSQYQYGTGGPYSMPSAVLLPNGLAYTFQYDACGNLLKVTYPSGGYTRYTYAVETAGATMPSDQGGYAWYAYSQNEVVARYVCTASSGSLGSTSIGSGDTCSTAEETTTYAPTQTLPNTGNTGNTVTDALGNSVVYQFSQASPPNFIPSLETSRKYYDSTGRLLKTVLTAYNPSNPQIPAAPTLPISETTILDNGFESQIQWSYNFAQFYQADSPMTEKREYDFGSGGSPGPLLRRTDYNWLQLQYPALYGFYNTTNPNAVHILDKKTSETVYDGGGNQLSQTTYQYDYNKGATGAGGSTLPNGGLGLLTQVAKWRNTDGALLTTNYTWWTGGMTQTTDPNGNVTNYDYTDNYADGVNRNSGAYPTTITRVNPNGTASVVKKQYYWGSGLDAATCGQNFGGSNCTVGLTSQADYTYSTYDLMGRPTSTISGDGGFSSTCYSDVSGASCYSSTYPLTLTASEAIASGLTKTSISTQDGIGRTTRSHFLSDPACSGGSYLVKTYDLDERQSTTSNPYCTTGDATYGISTTSYDGLGRAVQVTNPDGTYVTNTYTGRAVMTSDEGNGETESGNAVRIQRIAQKDALGRLTSVCEVSATTQQGSANNSPSACGLDVSGSGFLTNYVYDGLGDLTSVSQGAIGRSFTYNSLSQVLSATNPESGTTSYTYDSDGNMTSKTSQKGIKTTYTYDALNRLTGKSYSDGATAAACFAYDQSSSTRGLGRLTTEWTQAGTCPATPPSTGVLTKRSIAAYDVMGRVVTDQQCSTPGNCSTGTPYSVSYGYDLAGDVTSFTNGLSVTNAMTFSNVFDSADRLTTVLGPQTANSAQMMDLFSAATYTPAGGLVTGGLGPSVTLNRSYNKRFLPTSETDIVKTTPGVASIQITGAEQYLQYSTGSITFAGSEQSIVADGVTSYDGGTFNISINGSSPYQIGYGQNSTPQSLAASLAADISCSYGPVQAVASGATVYITSCAANPADSYAISAYLDGNSSSFPTPSFAVIPSGAKMVQPADSPSSNNQPLSVISFVGTEQSGNAGAFTIPFYNASTGAMATIVTVPWGGSSTSQSLAASLVSALKPCSSGGIISAVQNGSSVTMTSCSAGTNYVENVNIDVDGSETPSFAAEADAYLVTESGTYDSGTATLLVNGTQVASTTYGSASKPSTIVQGLVSSSANNTLVTLSPGTADPTYLSVTAKQASEDSYGYSLNFTHSSTFTQPSFGSSAPAGQLEGGQNAPLYNWVISSYAPNGNVLAMTDSVMGAWTYTYDDMNRLTRGVATSGPDSGMNLAWTYDRYGNRWSQGATGSGYLVSTDFTFTGNNNRIDQYSSNYDANGSQLKDANNTYTYDAENRLSSVNGTVSYIYDASGARIGKADGGTPTSIYIVNLAGQQLSELNGSGALQHSNIYAAGGRLLASYTPSSSSYAYNLTDWLGTKRMQTSVAGNESCTSLPFGDSLACTGTPDPTEQHFTGKDRDAESGLDSFPARYLESSFGRFMTPDWEGGAVSVPYANFADPQTLNLYAYAHNNPSIGIDIDGHWSADTGDEVQVEEAESEEAAAQASAGASSASTTGSEPPPQTIPGVQVVLSDGTVVSWRDLYGPTTHPAAGVSNQTAGLWDFPWAIADDSLLIGETRYAQIVNTEFVDSVKVPFALPSGLIMQGGSLSSAMKSALLNNMEATPYVTGAPSLIKDFTATKTLAPDPTAFTPGKANQPGNPQGKPFINSCLKNIPTHC